MGFPDPVIAAHKRGERYRLGRGKCGVPAGAVLGAGHFPAEFPFVRSRNLMPDKLLFAVRMLAFTQPREVLRLNRAGELPLLGEPALPLAMALLIAAPELCSCAANSRAGQVCAWLADSGFEIVSMGSAPQTARRDDPLHRGLMG